MAVHGEGPYPTTGVGEDGSSWCRASPYHRGRGGWQFMVKGLTLPQGEGRMAVHGEGPHPTTGGGEDGSSW